MSRWATTAASTSCRPRSCACSCPISTAGPTIAARPPAGTRTRASGHDVRVTARDFAQTVELAERHGMDAEVIGRHRGDRLGAKGIGLASRSFALARWACGRRFDLAFGHGSNDVTVAAWLLRIP